MKQSAGILLYRKYGEKIEVLLSHPAGPFWEKKDTWSIPKGELDEAEDHMAAARREFDEEVGIEVPPGEWIDLGTTKQAGKTNFIWALEGDMDPADFVCRSMFTLEWPSNSGQKQEFPENDRVAWFDLTTAKQKLFKGQIDFIDRLATYLGVDTQLAQLEASPPQQSLF